MQDMRELHEMGAITDEFMEALDEDYQQADRSDELARFMAEKSGAQPEGRPYRPNKSTRPVLNKSKRKRLRKLEKKARKSQRA